MKCHNAESEVCPGHEKSENKACLEVKNKGSVALTGGSTVGVACLPPSDCAMLCNVMLWFVCLLTKTLHELQKRQSIHTERIIRTPNKRVGKFMDVKFMLIIPI